MPSCFFKVIFIFLKGYHLTSSTVNAKQPLTIQIKEKGDNEIKSLKNKD